MALNNQRFAASELDFDAIKTNLKDFMSGQSQFTDYDFDGSSLSILLDVLAYNTHYRALYDNFILNEMFLDSASKRDNVVSRAKELGYTPMSTTGSTAYVNLSVFNTVGGPSVLVLPRLTQFSASINSIDYSFVTLDSYSTTAIGSSYVFNNLKLTQGKYMTTRFAYGTKYVLKNPNIDTSTLLVKVQDNAQSSIYTTFNKVDGIVGIVSTSNAFWLKEVQGGLYELEFGNGVVGTQLLPGNIVHCEYVVSDGSQCNGTKLFKYNGDQLYNGTASIQVISQGSGGTEIESIDSIKFNAPRLFSSQNRAVTVEDYRSLVYSLVPEAASVNVWSGADNIPPVYGKVFICIKPKTVEKFTNIEKITIAKDIIGSKNLVTVIPEIIDPTYIKVSVQTSIYFDQKTTTKSANDIKLAVLNTISDYNNTSLLKFDSILRFSKLLRNIDDADPSIVSNITSLMLHRKVDPKFDISATYTIDIVNPIYASNHAESSVVSSGFYILGSDLIHYVEDDGIGNLYLYNIPDATKRIVNNNIGSVAYSTGRIQITGLHITAIAGPELILTVKPSSYDIVSVLDQLVIIPIELVNVNVISDKSLSASGGGANYVFTTSRS